MKPRSLHEINLFYLDKCHSWILQNEKICFGAKNNKFAKFEVDETGTMTGIKFIHVSGWVSCLGSAESQRTNRGCNYEQGGNIMVILTDKENKQFLPVKKTYGYLLPGYDSWSKVLNLTNLLTPRIVEKGTEIRVWYYEDLYNVNEGNNDGTSCASVYVKFKCKPKGKNYSTLL